MNASRLRNQFHQQYIPALDGWRGLAVLLVLLWHLWPRNGEPTPWFVSFGWTGVDLFFVLSGFLISRILLAAKAQPNYFRNFYARRCLRIFPLYYATVLGVYLVWPWLDQQPVNGWQAAWAFLYATNAWSAITHHWFAAPPPWNGSHLWTLAIEEQFYLVWPFVVLRLGRRSLMLLCGSLVLLTITARCIAWWISLPQVVPYVATFSHVDGLAVGAAIAIVALTDQSQARSEVICRWVLLASSTTILAVFIYCQSFDVHTHALVYTLGISTLPGFFGSLLFLSLVQPAGGWLDRVMRAGLLRWFGKYSYGLYLYHGFMVILFQGNLWQWTAERFGTGTKVRLTQFLVSTLLCNGVAFLSYHLFEKQFFRLKRRFVEPTLPDLRIDNR